MYNIYIIYIPLIWGTGGGCKECAVWGRGRVYKECTLYSRVHQFRFFCKFQKDEYGVCLPRFFFFAPPPNLRWLFEVLREFPQPKKKIFLNFFL